MSNQEPSPPKVAGRNFLVSGLSEASLEAVSTDIDMLASPSLSGWTASPHGEALILSPASVVLGRSGATAPTPRRAQPMGDSIIAAADLESPAAAWSQAELTSPRTKNLGRHGAAAPTPRRAAPIDDSVFASMEGQSPASPSTAGCSVHSPATGHQVVSARTPRRAVDSSRKRPWGHTPRDHTARYWNDESYARFYESSQEEQTIMMSSTAGAGLTRGGFARMATAWRIRGEGVPLSKSGNSGYRVALAGDEMHPGQLSERQVARFQEVFAELSGGRGCIRASEAPVLLRALGVPLPAALVAQLLQKVVADEQNIAQQAVPGTLPYSTALRLYLQVLLPDVTSSVVRSAIDEFVEEVSETGCATKVLPVDRQHVQLDMDYVTKGVEPFQPKGVQAGQPPGVDPFGKLHNLMRHAEYGSLYRPPASSSPRPGTPHCGVKM